MQRWRHLLNETAIRGPALFNAYQLFGCTLVMCFHFNRMMTQKRHATPKTIFLRPYTGNYNNEFHPLTDTIADDVKNVSQI